MEVNPIETRSSTSRAAPWLSGGIFEYDAKRERLQEVNRELENPKIWDKPERAQELGRERARLDEVVTNLDKLTRGLDDSQELLNLLIEEGDAASVGDVAADVTRMDQQVADMEFRRM